MSKRRAPGVERGPAGAAAGNDTTPAPSGFHAAGCDSGRPGGRCQRRPRTPRALIPPQVAGATAFGQSAGPSAPIRPHVPDCAGAHGESAVTWKSCAGRLQKSGSADRLPAVPDWLAMQPVQSPTALPKMSEQRRLTAELTSGQETASPSLKAMIVLSIVAVTAPSAISPVDGLAAIVQLATQSAAV